MNRVAIFRLYVRRNALFFKVLLSYIVTGTILLSILSYMMYESYSKNIMDEIEKHADQMLGQSRDVVETYWSSTLNYLDQMHLAHRNLGLYAGTNGSAPLFYALYGEDLTPLQTGEVSRKLKEITEFNPIIQSVYVYNRRADLVFSNVTVSQPIREFFDQDIIERLESGTLLSDISYVPRKMHYRLAAEETDMNTISVIYVEDSTSLGPVSVLIFNLKQDALQRMVQPVTAEDASKIFLINREGVVISHPQMDWFNRNLSDEPFVRRILNSGSDQGMFTADVMGRKSLVAYNKSDSHFGWTFVSVGDYDLLLRKFTESQRVITLLALAFILLSILTGVFFTGSFYKPIRRLLGKLKRNTAAQPAVSAETPLSEYDYLNQAFDYLMNNVNELEASVRDGRGAMVSEFLKKLIRGGVIGKEEMNEKQERLGIRLAGPYYVVCVLRVASYVSLRVKLTARDQALFRYGLMNIGAETLAPEFSAEAVDGDSDHVALIVNMPDGEEETAAALRKKLAEVQANVRRFLGITATASTGSPVNRRRDISLSYSDALRNSDYRLLLGKEAVIAHSDIRAMEHDPYDYPAEMEKMLTEAVRSADRERMLEAIDVFLARALRFSYDGMLLALTQLVLSVIGTIPPADPDSAGKRPNLSYKMIIDELAACEDKDDIRNWLVSLCDSIMALYRAKRDHKNRELVDRMMQFVEEGYRNPNLTVEGVSDYVGLSPNYVRTIFKNQTGQSLSAYIAERRFREAKKLLLETDEHANKIAEAVGFASVKYFYSAFKKATGHTPEQYRKAFGGR